MSPSPRNSSSYERLEGGLGPSRGANGSRFAWKKFAIAAVCLIGVVYVFGPREPRNMGWGKKITDPGALLQFSSAKRKGPHEYG